MKTMHSDKKQRKGACISCAHFIDDRKEIEAEIKFLNNHGKLVLHTAERVDKGEATRTIDYKITVEQALARLGLAPARVGLCEIGVARFVDKLAGQTKKDKCNRWKEKNSFFQRSDNWRATSRQFKEDVEGRMTPRSPEAWASIAQELLPTDLCPCGSGNIFGFCCAPVLQLGKARKPS